MKRKTRKTLKGICSHKRLSLEILEPRVLLSAQYSITNLGTLGGDFAVATGINDSGQATGYSLNDMEQTWPFLWENGLISSWPESFSGYGSEYGYGNDINNAGHIAGEMDHWQGNELAYYYDGAAVSNIHGLSSEYSSSAEAINNLQPFPTIVGYYYDTNNLLPVW